MNENSINAYNLPDRVASYDSDMELMHPNRSKMIKIALEVLPFATYSLIETIDIGVGTGYFTEQLLLKYPKAHIIAVDGAEAMVDLAKARLGSSADNVDFKIGDFRQLSTLASPSKEVDVVYSSYALHHLNPEEKLDVIKQSLNMLKPESWFLNADVIISECQEIEKRFQEIRINGIMERATGKNERFKTFKSTRKFLDDLEANEKDQPLCLSEDLKILEEAGLKKRTVFWLDYREAVIGGTK